MKKRGIRVGFLALLAALAVSGCSDDSMLYQKAGDTATFRDNKTDATVFFTAAYDNPDDRPTFADSFRVHADLGYVGDISDTQYTDVRLQAGRHTLNVNRLDWSGYSLGSATITVDLQPGQTLYVEERVHAGDNVTLLPVDAKQGARNIVARKRICDCGNMLGIEF